MAKCFEKEYPDHFLEYRDNVEPKNYEVLTYNREYIKNNIQRTSAYFTGEVKLEDAVQNKSPEEKNREDGKRLKETRKERKLTLVQLSGFCK